MQRHYVRQLQLSLKAMEMEVDLVQGLVAKPNEMLMMGEKEYLGALSQRGKLWKNRNGAFIIKGDQQVIQN